MIDAQKRRLLNALGELLRSLGFHGCDELDPLDRRDDGNLEPEPVRRHVTRIVGQARPKVDDDPGGTTLESTTDHLNRSAGVVAIDTDGGSASGTVVTPDRPPASDLPSVVDDDQDPASGQETRMEVAR